ncbi:MAG: SIMPL domain-containing protein [Deltaproteobacteria bacterium]|nr:MAG: SIMPL domain-containing protein [Deltaproteobacteria bacterium]
MEARFAAIVSILLLLITFVPMTFAEEESGLSTIEVVGTGKILARPNLATISLSVETNAREAEQAIKENAARTKQLLHALKRIVKANGRLTTSDFTLSPIYEKEKRLHPTGFRVRNMITLQTKSLENVGTYIDEASKMGASRIASLTFSNDNEKQLRKEAAAEAVRQAIKSAEILGKAAGLTIKRISKISYAPSAPVRPYRSEASFTAIRTPIEVGDISIEARVNVIFEAN